jgi:hypothetical protein
MIPSAASDRAAREEGYIGDKGHEVRPSLIRKAAIACSLFDASDFAPSRRRWVGRDWSHFNPSMHERTPAFRASNNRRSRSQRYTDDLLIRGQDK